MNQTNSTPVTLAKGKKSNTALIIIIVIVVALIVLGVGGYFGWKFVSSKYLKKGTSNPTVSNAATTSFTLTQLEEMLKYPNGTLVSTDRSDAAGYTSVMLTQTSDSIGTANNYYLSLNSNSKWTVTAKSLESDGSRADITYEGSTKDKFTVHLIIDNNGEKTEILARIDAEDLPVGTPLGGTGSSVAPTTSTPSSAVTSSSASGTKTTISTDYVIADSATRVVSESELTNLSAWQLKVARNEIYARHGRPFVHKDLQCYFATKSWYSADESFTESVLSATETKNIATIQAYEQKINSPLQNTDSGC